MANAMQSAVLEGRGDELEEENRKGIPERIQELAQGRKLEIQAFKLSSERVEDGISITFELRALIKFDNNSETVT
jgi:hypothetical protein